MKRWLLRASKALLVLAALAGVACIVCALLMATVFPEVRGCEECGAHIGLVILTIFSIAVAMVCILVAGVLALLSTYVKSS